MEEPLRPLLCWPAFQMNLTLFSLSYFVMHKLISFPVHSNMALVLQILAPLSWEQVSHWLYQSSSLHSCHANCVLAFDLKDYEASTRKPREAQRRTGLCGDLHSWGNTKDCLISTSWVLILSITTGDKGKPWKRCGEMTPLGGKAQCLHGDFDASVVSVGVGHLNKQLWGSGLT